MLQTTLTPPCCIKRPLIPSPPIQSKIHRSVAIPILQGGRDLLMAATPGSGATAAYMVPLLQALHRQRRLRGRGRNRAYPPAVVVAPSRELAQQVRGAGWCAEWGFAGAESAVGC